MHAVNSRWALYHDSDELKCETVREAIKAGAITDGEVICGDIKQLAANDVRGFRRVHFFCGGGFWDLALNLAGWPDEPVWTGSCPCPSFSAAGKGRGFDDARHLWPEWFRLIGKCRPASVFGEQVGAAIGHGWLDLVGTDLEDAGYAVAAAVFGACSVGAPHLRKRLYFCADTEDGYGWSGERGTEAGVGSDGERRRRLAGNGSVGGSAESLHTERRPVDEHRPDGRNGAHGGRSEAYGELGTCSEVFTGDGADTDGGQSEDGDVQRGGEQRLFAQDRGTGDGGDATQRGLAMRGSAPGDGRHAALAGGTGHTADTQSRDQQRLWKSDKRIGPRQLPIGRHGAIGDTAHASKCGRRSGSASESGQESGDALAEQRSESGGGDDAERAGLEGHFGDVRDWRGPGWLDPQQARSVAEAGATRGWWADCDWWYGRDGKYRPIEPGIFPLAAKYPNRVGLLRLAGDAIVIAQAKEFIKSYVEARTYRESRGMKR